MDREPDFFLSCAGEYKPLSEPHACWTKARLADRVRDDYMLIEIKPELPGQLFDVGDSNITQLIISTRHEGYTLYPITEWPVSVYVTRILDESIFNTLFFTENQIELIAWGMIFRTLEEAIANARKVDSDVTV